MTKLTIPQAVAKTLLTDRFERVEFCERRGMYKVVKRTGSALYYDYIDQVKQRIGYAKEYEPRDTNYTSGFDTDSARGGISIDRLEEAAMAAGLHGARPTGTFGYDGLIEWRDVEAQDEHGNVYRARIHMNAKGRWQTHVLRQRRNWTKKL